MRFTVRAKLLGDAIEFEIEAVTAAIALELARQEASQIFGYTGKGDMPKVSVRPAKEEN